MASAETERRDAPPAAPGWWTVVAPTIFAAHLVVTLTAKSHPLDITLIDTAFLITSVSGRRGRRYTYLLMPLWIVGVVYVNLGLLEPYRGEIHVGDLYRTELALFGIESDGVRRIPAFFLADFTHPVLDFLCGSAYLLYFFQPMVFALYFLFRDQDRTKMVAWGYLACNLIGVAGWLAYPAAPPWYVEQYGLGPALEHVTASAAGAARFDELLGIGYFAGFYARNTNVFGAMPSLHVAYPTMIALAVWTRGRSWGIGCALFAALVAFSAVYLQHHYVLDVLAGATTGVVAYAIVWRVNAWTVRRSEVRLARVPPEGGATEQSATPG